jgi:hypothetical protein
MHSTVEFTARHLTAAPSEAGVLSRHFTRLLAHVIALLSVGLRAIRDGKQRDVAIKQLGALF